MKLGPATAVAAVLAAAVTGCASAAGTSAAPGRPAVTAGTPVPYTLYTQCGIDEASIGGRWSEADHPLPDGNGHPPPGWGNPGQPGTIRMLSATTAEFCDSLHSPPELPYSPEFPRYPGRRRSHAPGTTPTAPRQVSGTGTAGISVIPGQRKRNSSVISARSG